MRNKLVLITLGIFLLALAIPQADSVISGGVNIGGLDFTFEIISSPIISLISPSDGVVQNDYSDVTLQYNVTSSAYNVDNCSLWLDSSLEETDSSITVGEQSSFTYTPTYGEQTNHSWLISCYDNQSMQGNSSERSFKFTVDLGPGAGGIGGSRRGGGLPDLLTVVDWKPEDMTILPSGTKTFDIFLYTNKVSRCAYSEEEPAAELLQRNRFKEMTLIDITNDIEHKLTIDDTNDGDEFTFYFICTGSSEYSDLIRLRYSIGTEAPKVNYFDKIQGYLTERFNPSQPRQFTIAFIGVSAILAYVAYEYYQKEERKRKIKKERDSRRVRERIEK